MKDKYRTRRLVAGKVGGLCFEIVGEELLFRLAGNAGESELIGSFDAGCDIGGGQFSQQPLGESLGELEKGRIISHGQSLERCV